MGEMTSKTEATAPARRLHWTVAGLTNKEATGGYTAYVAEAEGVKYRIVGELVAGRMDGARKFRAYRVVGERARDLHPVREGGALKLLKWAKEECELDLADVIARREIDEAAEWQASPAYRHFARATQLAGGYRGALDLLHAEAAAEHRARFGPAVEFAGSHAFRPGKADARHCDFADCGARAESPNHNGWAPREVEFPTLACPDAEAGKPHAAHRIAGTWRDDCPGVERVVVAPELADAAGVSPWLAGKLAAHLGEVLTVHDEHPRPARRLVGRSCCPSTEGDVHDRSCETDEARAQWAPRTTAAPIREALDRVAVAAYEAVEAAIEAASSTPAAAGPDPATDDDSNELLDRIVRRAQFTALRAMLDVLDGWERGAREDLAAREASPAYGEYDVFHSSDIRRMVNDAAAELRVPAPYVPPAPNVGPQFTPGDRVYPRSGGEVYTLERVAVIEGSAGRQQFWAVGNAIPRHSDEYQLVKSK